MSTSAHTCRFCGRLFLILRLRAVCDDLENFLNVPFPLTEDTTITLDVGVIACASPNEGLAVEHVLVQGGTLTIASDSTVQ